MHHVFAVFLTFVEPKLRFQRDVRWARVVMDGCDVFAGTGAKIYDIAPVVCLLFHLLAQPAAAVTSAFLSQI